MPKWVHETIVKTRFKRRKNWQWQLQGYFTLREIKTGRIFKTKGYSNTFKDLRNKRKHHREAINQALYKAGGTNWVVVKSSYKVIRWRKLKKRKD